MSGGAILNNKASSLPETKTKTETAKKVFY